MKIFIFISLFFSFETLSQTHTGTGPSGEIPEDRIFCGRFGGSARFLEEDFMHYHKMKIKDDTSFQSFVSALLIQRTMQNIEPPNIIAKCDCSEEKVMQKLKKILKHYKSMQHTTLTCSEVVLRLDFIPKLESLIKTYEKE